MTTLAAGVLFVVLLAGTEAFFTVRSVLNLQHQEQTVAAERERVVGELGIDDPERALACERTSAGVGATVHPAATRARAIDTRRY